MRSATSVMSENTLLPFDLPSIARKKVSVGFDGGQLSSDAGVLVLRGVEKKLGLAARLASCIRDRRNPERIVHPLEEMLRLRMFAIAAGYEDADDCDSLRYDPIFKMAVGRAAGSRWSTWCGRCGRDAAQAQFRSGHARDGSIARASVRPLRLSGVL